MNHPDADLLAAVALGDPVEPEVREHVGSCPQCRADVEAYGRARDVLREPMPPLVAPPASLRASVLSAAFSDDPPGRRRLGVAAEAEVEPAPVALEPARLPERGRRRRVGLGWVAGAAAAGIAIGAATVSLADRDADPVPAPSQSVLAQVSLDTLDTGRKVGSADLVETRGVADLTVRTGTIDASGGYIEVWLINKDLQRMVSVGVLDPALDDQTFTVPAELVAQGYVIVDVSREPFDADTTHSGESLMRGELPI